MQYSGGRTEHCSGVGRSWKAARSTSTPTPEGPDVQLTRPSSSVGYFMYPRAAPCGAIKNAQQVLRSAGRRTVLAKAQT
jgi:hypothetical protein